MFIVHAMSKITFCVTPTLLLLLCVRFQVLMSQEIKGKGVWVGILHPGFNRTNMTSKYAHIWDKEGAVSVQD